MTSYGAVGGSNAAGTNLSARLDEDVVAIAKASDQAAFKRVFADIVPRLRSFFRGQSLSEGMIDEILQETMLKVWRKAELFDPEKSTAVTWIYSIARNAKIDRLRKENKPEPDMTDPYFVGEDPSTGEEFVNQKQDANLIRQAMTVLSPEQVRIITLSFYEDMSHGEIAKELGLPLGTVKSRIRLAFGKLRSELEKVQ